MQQRLTSTRQEVQKMKMNKDVITRDFKFNFETRNDTEKGLGIIEGRPIVYNSKTNLGCFSEIIERGALDNANLKDVRLCLNHDTSFVYARSRNNNENSTMQIKTDEKGLFFTAKLDIENSPRAKDLYSAISRGDISKMSFMFTIDQEEWEDLESEHPTRHIRAVDEVFEISAVTFPAYDATEITARNKETLDRVKATLDSVKKRSLDNEKDALELEKAKNRNKIY